MTVFSHLRFSEITVCLGKPYVYIHNGDCQHHVIVNDLRIHSAMRDDIDVGHYPMLLASSVHNAVSYLFLIDSGEALFLEVRSKLAPATKMRLFEAGSRRISSSLPYQPWYPPMSHIHFDSQIRTLCQLCGKRAAKWAVKDHPKLPHDPYFLCFDCNQHINYADGVKKYDFKLFCYPDWGLI